MCVCSFLSGTSSNDAEVVMSWLKSINVRGLCPVRLLETLAKELESLAGRQRVQTFEADVRDNPEELLTPWARTKMEELREVVTRYPCSNVGCVNTTSLQKKKVVSMNANSDQDPILVRVFPFAFGDSSLPSDNPFVNVACSKCCPTATGNEYPDRPLDFLCKHGVQAIDFLDVDEAQVAASCNSTAVWKNEFDLETIPSVLNLTALKRDKNHKYNLAPFYMKNKGRPRRTKRGLGAQDRMLRKKNRRKNKNHLQLKKKAGILTRGSRGKGKGVKGNGVFGRKNEL